MRQLSGSTSTHLACAERRLGLLPDLAYTGLSLCHRFVDGRCSVLSVQLLLPTRGVLVWREDAASCEQCRRTMLTVTVSATFRAMARSQTPPARSRSSRRHDRAAFQMGGRTLLGPQRSRSRSPKTSRRRSCSCSSSRRLRMAAGSRSASARTAAKAPAAVQAVRRLQVLRSDVRVLVTARFWRWKK